MTNSRTAQKERDEFSWSLRPKSKEQLNILFNELTGDSDDPLKSDFTRGQAGEKAAIVKYALDIRKSGGFIG